MDDENRKTRDEERKREQQERKSRDIVQLWDDKTDAESYLEVFEVSIKEAMQPEDQWVPIFEEATYRQSIGNIPRDLPYT